MPDLWMDVDAALAEVPLNIFPLLDDTDFKSIEGAVAYNAAGMALRWHFVTTAGAYTVTSVTPTTGGNYDWTDQGDAGIYTIEIPASGGASANNDTEGFGWFTGVATGVLPWRGPTIGFRAAGLNDLLIDSAYSTTRGLAGTALPAAAADAAGGLPISDAGGLDMDAILVDTGTTLDALIKDVPTVAEFEARTIAAANYATAAALATVDGIVDDILVDTGTTLDGKLNTIDDFLDTEVAAILADTNELQTDWVNGGRLDLILDIIAADTTTDIPALINDLPTNAELATALGTADDAVLAELAKVPKSDSNVSWNATALASINAAMDTALDTPIPGSPTADSINERVATMDTSVALMRLLIATGTVVDDNDPDPTATAFETNLAEASNDHYNGAFLVFTSGALLGQSRKIAGYVGATKVITTSAFTEAPAGGDTFAILGRSE